MRYTRVEAQGWSRGSLACSLEARLTPTHGEGLHLLFLQPATRPDHHLQESAALAVPFPSQFSIRLREDPSRISHARAHRARQGAARFRPPAGHRGLFRGGFRKPGFLQYLVRQAKHVGESPSSFRRRMNRLYRSAEIWSGLAIPHCFLYRFFAFPEHRNFREAKPSGDWVEGANLHKEAPMIQKLSHVSIFVLDRTAPFPFTRRSSAWKFEATPRWATFAG